MVRNVTTAANLWLASAIGIAAGAAQFELAGIAFLLGLILLVVVGEIERRLMGPKAENAATAEGETEAAKGPMNHPSSNS